MKLKLISDISQYIFDLIIISFIRLVHNCIIGTAQIIIQYCACYFVAMDFCLVSPVEMRNKKRLIYKNLGAQQTLLEVLEVCF